MHKTVDTLTDLDVQVSLLAAQGLRRHMFMAPLPDSRCIRPEALLPENVPAISQTWWDEAAKSDLLLGVFIHGWGAWRAIADDRGLCIRAKRDAATKALQAVAHQQVRFCGHATDMCVWVSCECWL